MLCARKRRVPAAMPAASRLRVWPFGTDPVVALGVFGDLVDPVGEIGELVHDEVRGEADDGVDERDL